MHQPSWSCTGLFIYQCGKKICIFEKASGHPTLRTNFSCQKVGQWSQSHAKRWVDGRRSITNHVENITEVIVLTFHHKKFEKWIHEEQFTVRFLMNLTPKYQIIFCMSFQVLYWSSNFPEFPRITQLPTNTKKRSHYHYSPLLFCPMIHSRCAYCQIARMKLLCVSIF